MSMMCGAHAGACHLDWIEGVLCRGRASAKPSPRMSSGVPNYAKEYRFCPSCGEGKLTERVPDGDGRSRLVCNGCGNIMYFNPKIVSAALTMTADRSRVLLVKRSIPPVGKWTIPAGFMEIGENSSDGAIRETKEEANADVTITSVIAVYNILAAAQVQIMYLAYLLDEHVEAGSETSEARLFAWDEVPWDSLAFATVTWALEYARSNLSNIDNVHPQLRTKQMDGSYIEA